jgi:lambda family phage portal protein
MTMRGGVEVDEWDCAIAYHIRRAHQGDWFSAAKSVNWDRIERETAWGRPIVIHDFEHNRAGEHRGGAGVLTPVLQRLKMLAQYDGAELDSALLNAVFSAYVESPFDQSLVEEALGEAENLGAYQEMRADFHEGRKIAVGGAQITKLFPGEKIGMVDAKRPNVNFATFEKAVLRNAASAVGISAQQASQDWSDTNYSSARAALLEAWKTMSVRRTNFGSGFGQPIADCFVEESMEVDDLPLPAGAPEYIECRTAYSRAEWMGPGRGWVDPVAEKQGAVLGMDAGLSTLQAECAEQGLDYEEVLFQRKREIELFNDLGIPVPTWAGMNPPNAPMRQNATEVSKKPEVV